MNPPVSTPARQSFFSRVRAWFITGVVVIAPTAVTFWVLFRLLNWVDNLLGRYLRFAALEYQRIPGVGIVYGSTKSLGEAFLNQKEETFRKVVLVQWPHPGIWRVGFLTGHVAPELKAKLGQDVSCVFVPHTPNPASGFVHYVPKKDLIE